ncbi:MAG: 30S ribosomal protein S6 [Clostridium sp.]|nr:30S ribosomal protein S6 [Clostridium sp.]
MRKYELLTIIKPNMDAEEADKIIAKIEDIVKSLGGNVFATDKMGRKKLAHDIQNFRDGHFVAQRMDLAPDKVVELKRQLRLNDNILRIMFMEDSKVNA